MKHVLLIALFSTALFFTPQSASAQSRSGLATLVENVLEELNPFSVIDDIKDIISEGEDLVKFIRNTNNSFSDCVQKAGQWMGKVAKAATKFLPPPVRAVVKVLVRSFWAVFGSFF